MLGWVCWTIPDSAMGAAAAADVPWQWAGVARREITPTEPIRLTGYASRKTPSVGIEQKLWTKALALGRDADGPALLITLDLCGIAESTYQEAVRRVTRNARVRRERVALACTHTHSGPCTTGWAPNIFVQDLIPDEQATIDRYTGLLLDQIEQVAADALRDRRPGRLAWAQGTVGFARNRRQLQPSGYRIGDNPVGPVDHALPVLRFTDAEGHVRAVVANYACHSTTIGGDLNRVCGDWPGFAQEALERDHPGALALVTLGCGADANPSPRGGADFGLALARQHGESLAAEVRRLSPGEFAPLNGRFTARLRRVAVPFAPPITRAQWEERATKPGIVGYHARKNLARLDRGEKLPKELNCYVQTWTFGNDLALVFLPGEVVVDYSLRLKKEFDSRRLWISGYANSVPCYIPSARILNEGGYEAEDSLWYYDRPARLAPDTEDRLVNAVHALMPRTFLAPR